MTILEVNSVKKIYTTMLKGNNIVALDGITFSAEDGEFTAIMGESGSGKTTLLNIIATLDKPTSGSILLNQRNIIDISEKEVSSFRRENLGFVFQDFNLLDNFNIKDNVLLPLVLAEKRYEVMEKSLEIVSESLGITELWNKYPFELSGGQKQRAAIARAIITDPQLILADEPTGSLDSNSSEKILDLFRQINRNGQTILMVTHSVKAASRADRILFLRDGRLFHQIYRGGMKDSELHKKISDTLVLLSSGGDQDE